MCFMLLVYGPIAWLLLRLHGWGLRHIDEE